jgi:hypothetical protein
MGLNQPQAELPAAIFVVFDEILKRRWNVVHLKFAAAPNFEGYIFRRRY